MKVNRDNGSDYGLMWKLVCLTVLLFYAGDSRAQASSSSHEGERVVVVQSWKQGDSKIAEQVLNASLQSDLPQYEFDVFSAPEKDRHFRLRLRQSVENTVRTPGLPCWIADLREITKDNISTANQIGYNLLSVEGAGAGDNFPREEWAGYFCPIEKPNKVLDGLFYPMKAERKFFVEGFVLALQVTDYHLSKEQKKLTNVELRISFSNQ